jgi:hypothetical protein
VRFIPYEDVLGIGHDLGYSSIVVPGAGEATFDAFEANPFATSKVAFKKLRSKVCYRSFSLRAFLYKLRMLAGSIQQAKKYVKRKKEK